MEVGGARIRSGVREVDKAQTGQGVSRRRARKLSLLNINLRSMPGKVMAESRTCPVCPGRSAIPLLR